MGLRKLVCAWWSLRLDAGAFDIPTLYCPSGPVRIISEFVNAKTNAAVLPLLGSISDGEIASLDTVKR